MSPPYPFQPTAYITQHLTLPEQALAACEGWEDTTKLPVDVWPPSELIATDTDLTPDTTLPVDITLPLAYVWTLDGAPFTWPSSFQDTREELAGGHPLEPMTIVSTSPTLQQQQPTSTPQPRPRPRPKPLVVSENQDQDLNAEPHASGDATDINTDLHTRTTSEELSKVVTEKPAVRRSARVRNAAQREN